MKPADPIDAGRLTLALNELRLPAIKTIWPDFAVRADKEGWPAARFLAALTEHELAERSSRRIQRHLEEARLPPGKTLDSFEFDAVPTVSKAQVMALAAGDSWLDNGANLLMFGPPGGGKSHLAAALGLALVENGWRVLFARTTDLVQRLQTARRDLQLEAAIARLDKYHLLILDDLAYVSKSLTHNVCDCDQRVASLRVMSWTEAMKSQAVELSRVVSKSLARRRFRPSQAKVRSTTHRRGSSTKPLAVSDRLMISMTQSPRPARACRSLSPA